MNIQHQFDLSQTNLQKIINKKLIHIERTMTTKKTINKKLSLLHKCQLVFAYYSLYNFWGILRSIISIFKGNKGSIILFTVQFLGNFAIDRLNLQRKQPIDRRIHCTILLQGNLRSITSICKGNSRSIMLFTVQFLGNFAIDRLNLQRKQPIDRRIHCTILLQGNLRLITLINLQRKQPIDRIILCTIYGESAIDRSNYQRNQ